MLYRINFQGSNEIAKKLPETRSVTLSYLMLMATGWHIGLQTELRSSAANEWVYSSGTPAQSAASSAFTANGGVGAFDLTSSQLAINWTGLNVDPTNNNSATFFNDAANSLNANAQMTCTLNNTATPPAHEPTFILNGTASAPAPGIGTVIGWQTQVAIGNQCAMPSGSMPPATNYNAIMKSGYQLDSGQYIR